MLLLTELSKIYAVHVGQIIHIRRLFLFDFVFNILCKNKYSGLLSIDFEKKKHTRLKTHAILVIHYLVCIV